MRYKRDPAAVSVSGTATQRNLVYHLDGEFDGQTQWRLLRLSRESQLTSIECGLIHNSKLAKSLSFAVLAANGPRTEIDHS
jgi:hypothetical protein